MEALDVEVSAAVAAVETITLIEVAVAVVAELIVDNGPRWECMNEIDSGGVTTMLLALPPELS